MKDLVIMGHEPLSKRLKTIFCIEELIDRGVKLEYWDLSHYFFPGITIPDLETDVFVKKCVSLENVEHALKEINISNTVFVIEVFNSYINRKFFDVLKSSNCYCIKIDLYANTILPISGRDKYLKWFSLKNYTFKKICSFLYVKFYLIGLYKHVLSSSTNSKRDICINHPDFESFMIDSDALIKENYIVFLDVYYPLHPDLVYYYKFKSTSAEDYYSLMNKYFDHIEQRFNTKVIIAAHPKSMYKGDEFGNRLIIKYQTNNLVKFASYVITHESNTLSYIALSNKPFAIVYPDSYRLKPELFDYLIKLANYCDKTLYNLDKCDWDKIEYSALEDVVRENYIYNFLTSKDIEGKRNVDIFFELLQ